ncbi:MAG: DUF3365 domain-containing protein [Hyphomicrobiaceae bacterium]
MARVAGARLAIAAAGLLCGLSVVRAQQGPLPPDSAAGVATGAIGKAVPFDLARSLEDARQVVKLFKDRLKGELSTAIRTDGAANAISLCQTVSPDISTELGDASGFEVVRTSLRLRNPENAPGAWELEVLRSFEQQATAGSDPDKLEQYAEEVTPEGDRLWRYMRGIAVGDVCLSCHGTEIKADVKSELVRYYPDDKATGYKLGELRGAFSLVRLIE